MPALKLSGEVSFSTPIYIGPPRTARALPGGSLAAMPADDNSGRLSPFTAKIIIYAR